MDIEITYNPYITKTEISIDGTRVDGEFGALFPVRNFPMQCWLGKNGSWPGCAATLAAVARGRKFSLQFYGRTEDYADFHKQMSAYQWNRNQLQAIMHEGRFETEVTADRVNKICDKIEKVWRTPYKGSGSNHANKVIVSINKYMEQIRSVAHYIELTDSNLYSQREFVKSNNWLCVIPYNHDNDEAVRFADSCRSMRRCAESIVFYEERDGGRTYFAIDAEREKVEMSEAEFHRLWDKYGRPFELGTKIANADLLLRKFLEIASSEENLKKELSMMKQCMMKQSVIEGDDTDDAEYERLLDCTKWIRANKEEIMAIESLIANVWE